MYKMNGCVGYHLHGLPSLPLSLLAMGAAARIFIPLPTDTLQTLCLTARRINDPALPLAAGSPHIYHHTQCVCFGIAFVGYGG